MAFFNCGCGDIPAEPRTSRARQESRWNARSIPPYIKGRPTTKLSGLWRTDMDKHPGSTKLSRIQYFSVDRAGCRRNRCPSVNRWRLRTPNSQVLFQRSWRYPTVKSSVPDDMVFASCSWVFGKKGARPRSGSPQSWYPPLALSNDFLGH